MFEKYKKAYCFLLIASLASFEAISQETIFTKASEAQSSNSLTNEQKLLNKFMRNSRRKFNPRGVSLGQNMKSRIVAEELERRQQNLASKP